MRDDRDGHLAVNAIRVYPLGFLMLTASSDRMTLLRALLAFSTGHRRVVVSCP